MNAAHEYILNSLETDFFMAMNLSAEVKKNIFDDIINGIEMEHEFLQRLIVDEVKLTPKDAKNEVDRALNTFKRAKDYIGQANIPDIDTGEMIIQETRRARGPLLAITPFSSPLSSPAHKISVGLLVGTSILFKPSPDAWRTGDALYKIISDVCDNKLIYFLKEEDKDVLNSIMSDERIGIVSFTGSNATGKTIIQNGGVKRYHMELTGGNSPVIFAPTFDQYNERLAKKMVEGVVAKNGQRCVSVKHIFIPSERSDFMKTIRTKLQQLKSSDIGPLINEDYARATTKKVKAILQKTENVEALIALERHAAYISPCMYVIDGVNPQAIRHIMKFDLPGPIVFVHIYDGPAEYLKILAALKNDYVNSGIQLSIYVSDEESMNEASQNLLWGGIIFNEPPTFRHEQMSFGGFGKSGLGKEGFPETIIQYTDPQTIVYPRNLPTAGKLGS